MHLKRAEEGFVNAHHGCYLVELSAVVWRAAQCEEVSFREEPITTIDDLGKMEVDCESAIGRYALQAMHEVARRKR